MIIGMIWTPVLVCVLSSRPSFIFFNKNFYHLGIFIIFESFLTLYIVGQVLFIF